jgi:hypothetical protein
MLDRLRTPLLVVAIILVTLALGAEVGSRFLSIGAGAPASALRELRREATQQLERESDLEPDERRELVDEMLAQAQSGKKPPGVGVPSLGLVDGLLLYNLVLLGLGRVISKNVHGRVQGIVSLVVSILLLVAAILLIIGTFVKVLIMIALFLAAPFGTMAYLAMYGSFNRAGASAILSASMFLKLGGAVFLVLAHQGFLKMKGLMLLVVTSLVCNIIVSFLHGLVPIILVSITDAVAAIVIGIVAAIWAVALLVYSIIAIIRAVV